MQSRHVLTLLAARDVRMLARFYADSFSWVTTVDTETYVEFELPGEQRLGITDRSGFGHEATGDVGGGLVSPFGLELQVTDLAIASERLIGAGARPLSAAAKRPWGDDAALYADPEGNVLALAAVKDVKPPVGKYTRDEFVRRVSDVVRRSGVEDAEALVRDLENSVNFPMLARCGMESSLHWGARCVLLPGHEGYCESAAGAKWMRLGSSSSGE